MGRIKLRLVKRTSKQLLESSSDSFGKTFEENKKALGSALPSKKVRNKRTRWRWLSNMDEMEFCKKHE